MTSLTSPLMKLPAISISCVMRVMTAVGRVSQYLHTSSSNSISGVSSQLAEDSEFTFGGGQMGCEQHKKTCILVATQSDGQLSYTGAWFSDAATLYLHTCILLPPHAVWLVRLKHSVRLLHSTSVRLLRLAPYQYQFSSVRLAGEDRCLLSYSMLRNHLAATREGKKPQLCYWVPDTVTNLLAHWFVCHM